MVVANLLKRELLECLLFWICAAFPLPFQWQLKTAKRKERQTVPRDREPSYMRQNQPKFLWLTPPHPPISSSPGTRRDTTRSLRIVSLLSTDSSFGPFTDTFKLYYRMQWRTRNVLGRCSIRISVETRAVATDVCHGFPQSLQANTTRRCIM